MKVPFKLNMIRVALLTSSIGILFACNDGGSNNGSNKDDGISNQPLALKILHINDHHSHLDGVSGVGLNLGGQAVNAQIGGFPLLVTKMNELSQEGNVLKLHAGDAITGTMYYSLFREELPDAIMMNKVCFDAFELGNHEFDDGNEQLATFLDKLTEGDCGTQVLAANVEVPSDNPISGKYKPYTTFEYEGQTLGVIGLDIATKTKLSSSPSADTEFFDEAETAQKYIDELKAQGINKIILLTHYTYSGDKALAAKLTDVDVIVGGDSHSLLGDQALYTEIGYGNTQGDYPTLIQNKEGDDVCIVQAGDNARILGELNVNFTAEGTIESCAGTPHLLLGETFTKDSDSDVVALTNEEMQTVKTYVESQPSLSIVTADEATATTLKAFSDLVNDKMEERIGNSNALLCNERVPRQGHSSGSLCVEGSPERDFLNQHGSVMAHIVSKAFYEMSLRADLTIQNSGGVRTSIDAGEVTTGEAFNVLPFTNLLVNLELTGQEIVDTLEDAIDFSGTSSGAFPSTYNLRFDVDMTQEKGQRVSNVEARRRGESAWSAIELMGKYIVVTNDYIASGQDGYTSFIPAFEDDSRREDTGLLYTDSLINYIKALEEKGQSLEAPSADEMGVQSFTQ